MKAKIASAGMSASVHAAMPASPEIDGTRHDAAMSGSKRPHSQSVALTTTAHVEETHEGDSAKRLRSGDDAERIDYSEISPALAELSLYAEAIQAQPATDTDARIDLGEADSEADLYLLKERKASAILEEYYTILRIEGNRYNIPDILLLSIVYFAEAMWIARHYISKDYSSIRELRIYAQNALDSIEMSIENLLDYCSMISDESAYRKYKSFYESMLEEQNILSSLQTLSSIEYPSRAAICSIIGEISAYYDNLITFAPHDDFCRAQQAIMVAMFSSSAMWEKKINVDYAPETIEIAHIAAIASMGRDPVPSAVPASVPAAAAAAATTHDIESDPSLFVYLAGNLDD